MPQKSTKQRLIKRLSWYFQIEGLNGIMFFGILVFLNIQYTWSELIFLSYGLLLMCFILAQGAYYWWAKLSVLQGKNIFKDTLLSRFRKFKKQNLYGFMLIPVILILQWLVSGHLQNSSNFIFWGICANVFAILEHINYYHRQLMIDNQHDLEYVLRNRKLKEASLFKDLRENKL